MEHIDEALLNYKNGVMALHLSNEAVTSVPAEKNIGILVHCAHTLLPMHANAVDQGWGTAFTI